MYAWEFDVEDGTGTVVLDEPGALNEVCLYFWDDPDDPEATGWWLAETPRSGASGPLHLGAAAGTCMLASARRHDPLRRR